MTSKFDRDKILDSIHANVQDKNLIKHMLATEAIMRALAIRLGRMKRSGALPGLSTISM